MVRPQPCVLFAQSFLHPRLAEYVDEVRFTEPVVICACEFLELHTSSLCPTLSLSGVSFPQSFALEIFVRSGGEARFKRLCPAFLYSPSASSLLEVQAAVTDHLVIRGSYRALTLVVYGNSAKDLGQFNADHDIDSTLSDLILPSEAAFKAEDLPEALQHDRGNLGKVLPPLRHLQLVYRDPEQSAAMYQLLSLAVGIAKSIPDDATASKVFDVLLSAASTVLSEHGIESGFPQWPTLTKTHSQSQRKVKNALKQARDQIQGINFHLQKSGIIIKQSLALATESSVIEMICNWIQRSFQLSPRMGPAVSRDENLMGGLAAVQLLCTDAHWCFQFVVAGGMRLLMDVIQYSSAESSATALLVLGAIKCACRHAFACEALLGWWPMVAPSAEEKNDLSLGYSAILKLLLQTKRHHVAQLAIQVLHHLRAYELVSNFQSLVEPLLDKSSLTLTDLKSKPVSNHTLKKLNTALKQLVRSLSAKDFPQDWSPIQMAQWLILDGDDNAFTLPPNAIYSLITASKYSYMLQDLNAHILSVLQERRLIPSLAALLSAPWMRSAAGNLKDSFLEFVGTVEALVLALISSRSGLLFLATDRESASALISGLGGIEEFQGTNFINLRHACSLTSAGFLCNSQDVAGILHTSLSVIGAIDRLLATSQWSEDFLWALWELAVFTRSETGRQALSAITYFPEVFVVIVEALQPGSQSVTADVTEGRALKRAILHSAAEVMQVILMDPVASSLAAWIPHALALQKALQYCSPTNIDIAVGSHALSKDVLCARLLDWVDAAVIYHKKGPIGLLRYAAALVAGSVNQIAVPGLPTSDPVEPDTTLGESAASTELPSVDILLGRGITLGASGTVLPDTAVIQLTVSMRIMSSISCHPGVAAVLYGEGAMAVLYILLEYGAGFLQTSTSDYDYIVEEDGEGDGTTEMLLEQGREQFLLSLLLPTLLLLLSLLRRLQMTGEEYRNTRLVETLLQLHRGISARLASRVTVPPVAGGMLVLAAVARVLASVLACWPIFGWTPALFPKLLGADALSLVQTSNLLPLEPKEAVSVLCILGDMLPEEHPQLCTNGIAAFDILRSLAVQTLLGVKSMNVVGWHCQRQDSQKLVQAVALHLDHISSLVFHLACTTSAILEGLLIKLIIRMACQSEEHASTLVRPLLAYVRENTILGASVSEAELFRVERYLQFLKELVKHPAAKRVLLREGIVHVLLQAIDIKNNPINVDGKSYAADGPSSYLGGSPHVLNSFVSICDPDVTLFPEYPMSRRLVEECPGFVDFCSIATSLLKFCTSAPLGKELEIAAEAMAKLVNHQLGRAAFASVALAVRSSSAQSFSAQKDVSSLTATNIEIKDSASNILEEECSPFITIWERLSTALEANTDSQIFLVGVIEHFALAAIQLSAAGRSACGTGALQVLFEMDKRDKREPLLSILSLLKKREEHIQDEIQDERNYSPAMKIAYHKAHRAVMVLLRLLENSPATISLDKKVKVVVDGFPTPQPFKDQELTRSKMLPYWRLFPTLFENEKEEVDAKLSPETLEEMDIPVIGALKEKFFWECSAVLSDKPTMTNSASKRKSGAVADGGSKRHRIDVNTTGPAAEVGSSVTGNLTVRGTGSISAASASTRRDIFRQRKPNTSRPPSMHVDDYVARERGNEVVSAATGGMSQRSASGGGRPPSIHVDEFMARQRERQQVVGAPAGTESQAPVLPPPQSQSPPAKPESISNNPTGRVSRAILAEDDELQDVDIEIDGVPDADDLLSLSVADELVVMGGEESGVLFVEGNKMEGADIPVSITAPRSVEIDTNEVPRPVSTSDVGTTDDALKQQQPGKPSWQQLIPGNHFSVQGEEKEKPSPVRNNPSNSSPSTSQILQQQAPSGMDKVSSMVVPLRMSEASGTPLGTHVSASVGEHRPTMPQTVSPSLNRSHLQFPVAPPLPPPPPIPAGVIPQKYDTTSGMEQRPLPSASMQTAFDTPAKSNMGVLTGRDNLPPLAADYHRGIADNFSNSAPPPPPPPPPGPWQPVDPALRRMDPAHGPPLNPLTYSMVAPGRPSGPPSVGPAGTQLLHASLPPWPGMSRVTEDAGSMATGRPPPPLPPTPPPFSSAQAPLLQVSPPTPNSMPPSSSLYGHNIGRLPTESRPAYVLSPATDVPSGEKRFGTFTPSILGQSPMPQSLGLPAPFLPPLPPGRPTSSQGPMVSGAPLQLQQQQQHHFHHSQQILQPPPPPQQPEQTGALPQPQPQPQPQQPQFQQQMHQPVQPPPLQNQAQQSPQQESGKMLQQILASPDAIQDLLKDQNKLQQLLEQHPKLISLLQEKMGQG